ncbi:MAG: CBS domain-containing protein [Flavobacteriaceae bacterium]|jgi:CBS domain-containing protein|nr:CBS domain-containing protein [Flavobacteriaceae bacterium]
MIITKYISENVSSLSEQETIGKARQLMLDLGQTHIPIVNEEKLTGNISLNVVRNLNEKDTIKDHLIELEQFYLFERAIIFDSIHVFSENEANVIPIINTEGKFLGGVLEETVVDEFASVPFILEFGVFMTVTTPIQKYSVSEIANIVESNNGKILGLIVISIDEDTARITLKIKTDNISSIGDTFERFGYQISNKYFEDSKQELLKDRFDQFRKFMEV